VTISTGTITVTRLEGAPFGAELSVRSEGALSALDGRELRRLLGVHQFLLVEGGMTADRHLDLIRQFGRVLREGPRRRLHAPRPPGLTEMIYLSNVREGGVNGNDELRFHHEFAYLPTPVQGLSLYAEEIVAGVPTTRFASGLGGFRRLSEADQQRVQSLQALHVANYSFTDRNRDMSSDPAWPRAVHPVAFPHPVTGEWTLFVNPTQTDRILGLAEEESEALLGRLFGAMYATENIHEHTWTEGDLVIWDNRSLAHARRHNDSGGARTLRRVVFGEKSPWEEWPCAAPDRFGGPDESDGDGR
jgi:alpha-ketoglutarate-dependent taurine dioxygenase